MQKKRLPSSSFWLQAFEVKLKIYAISSLHTNTQPVLKYVTNDELHLTNGFKLPQWIVDTVVWEQICSQAFLLNFPLKRMRQESTHSTMSYQIHVVHMFAPPPTFPSPLSFPVHYRETPALQFTGTHWIERSTKFPHNDQAQLFWLGEVKNTAPVSQKTWDWILYKPEFYFRLYFVNCL